VAETEPRQTLSPCHRQERVASIPSVVYARAVPLPRLARRSQPARSAIDHERFMRLALEEARKALDVGEVPVGALLVMGEEVIASDFNQPIRSSDPTSHAEVMVLRSAARCLGNYRLTGTTLYVTLEPCLMCVGAIVNARVSRLVFGAHEPKTGAVSSLLDLKDLPLNHRLDVTAGILDKECRGLIQAFFKFRRGKGVG
jgi:tRNA(adenine34) deaminase